MKKDIFEGIGKEWKDYLETGKDEIGKKKFDTGDYIDDLLDCYEEWREAAADKGAMDAYQIATKLLKKYKIPSLSEDEINEFVDETKINKLQYRGIFFSIIIGKLYEDSEIHLYFNNSDCIGGYNKNKKIVVESDCGDWMGWKMKGGEIVVKGDCGYGTGSGMMGGVIKIYGDNFNPREQISKSAGKGEIYHKDKLVWKDGKFIGDSI